MKLQFIRNVLPGNIIHEKGIKSFGIHNGHSVIAGQLCKIENLLFVRSRTNRYCPMTYDIVVGRIIHTSVDYHRVDLGNVFGILPSLAFLNASNKLKPELQKGNLVLCQVTRVGPELLLSCKQTGLGKIDEAFAMPSWKMRHLYFSKHLATLGRMFNFKIAIAMNGYIWIKGDPKDKREILKYLQTTLF